jgi:hypothetical protein
MGRGVGPEGCPREGLAATRDASWFRKPGYARRYHVVAGDGGSGCSGMPLVLELARRPEDIEQWLRCGRRGCREKWPEPL